MFLLSAPYFVRIGYMVRVHVDVCVCVNSWLWLVGLRLANEHHNIKMIKYATMISNQIQLHVL